MLIERAGDFASKEIWHSIVQLITNYPQLHVYAAEKVCWLQQCRREITASGAHERVTSLSLAELQFLALDTNK